MVTGGGRGLGKALVEALAAAGADVAFSHRESQDGAQVVQKAVEARGQRAFTARADARRPGEMAGFVDQAASALGGIDLLVNNVGVFEKTPLESLEEEAMDEAFAVNVASLGGLRPWRSYLPYCATKSALIMATRCLALALGPEIRVNAVAPGILDPSGAGEAVRERVPLKRFGRVAEAVEAVLFLLAGATYSTGAVLAVDGGREHF